MNYAHRTPRKPRFNASMLTLEQKIYLRAGMSHAPGGPEAQRYLERVMHASKTGEPRWLHWATKVSIFTVAKLVKDLPYVRDADGETPIAIAPDNVIPFRRRDGAPRIDAHERERRRKEELSFLLGDIRDRGIYVRHLLGQLKASAGNPGYDFAKAAEETRALRIELGYAAPATPIAEIRAGLAGVVAICDELDAENEPTPIDEIRADLEASGDRLAAIRADLVADMKCEPSRE